MIFVVIIIFAGLLFIVLGTDSLIRDAKKVSRRRRQEELESKNTKPLLGFEKCSPQFQAYMRGEIEAGRAKPKTKTQEEEEKENKLKKEKEKEKGVYYGERGGRYRYRVNKYGELYRHYF